MDPCPFCGSTDRKPHGDRAAAACAQCSSLERQRAVARDLTAVLTPRGSARCLEVAPRAQPIYGEFLRARGWDYVGVDSWYWRSRLEPDAWGFIDRDADVTDLAFASTGSFELVIMQHVLEEIPAYPVVIDEVARVLERGGRLLLEVPWSADRSAHVRTPRDHHGNVWSFGASILDELERRFHRLERAAIAEGEYESEIVVCLAPRI